ncbi:hypothetical protein KEM54_003512, partial [Ascosphaera aggregata]
MELHRLRYTQLGGESNSSGMNGESSFSGPPPGPPPTWDTEREKPAYYSQNGDPERAAPEYGHTFAEAFKLEGPRYHDIWAGLL